MTGELVATLMRFCERLPTPAPMYRIFVSVSGMSGSNASAQLFQALNDTGWTIPAVAACYWAGEAMGSVDFKDLAHRPRKVTETAKMVAANAAHLARLLKASPYPG